MSLVDTAVTYVKNIVQTYVHLLTVDYPLGGLMLGAFAIFKLGRLLDSLLTVLMDTLLPSGPMLDKYRAPHREGSQNWAVVTGSTAGIGLQFAKQLAEAKFNVALVSRSPAKLAEVAAEIEAKHGVQTAVHALDAATAQAQQYHGLKAFVEKLGPVSVLINNLGVSHEMPVPFAELSDAELHNIVQVNVVSTLEITRAVLPKLQAHTETRGNRALILSMGSFAGLMPTPLLSVYSGSKLFLQGWSSALAEELKPSKIDVQLVLSYLVTSQMSKVRRTSLMIPNPRSFVKSALKQIGRRGGAQERAYTSTPYWSHALMHWAIENTLGVYSAVVAKINFRMHLGIRLRALRKKAKTQ